MPTEVKICGLSDEEGVDAALEAGADFVGFMLLSAEPAQRLAGAAPRRLRRAPAARRGSWRSPSTRDDALLAAIAKTLRPDLLQLHGKETPERVSGDPRRDRRAGDEGDRRCRAATILPRSPAIRRPTACSSTPSRRATPRGPAATASLSTGRCFEGFPRREAVVACPAGSSRRMSPRRLRRRARRASTSPPAWKARPGRKDPARIHAFVRGRARLRPARRRMRRRGARRVNIPAQPNTYRSGPDERGRFGLYGGRFVAETLMPLVLDLEAGLRGGEERPGLPGRARRISTRTTPAGRARSISPSG